MVKRHWESLPLESKLFEGLGNFKNENLKRTILVLEEKKKPKIARREAHMPTLLSNATPSPSEHSCVSQHLVLPAKVLDLPPLGSWPICFVSRCRRR